jgi:hypothetical protein
VTPWTNVRSALAVAVRTGQPPERIEALRRDYRAARAHAYLRALISADPPPTAAQRRELAAVLVGGGDNEA